ncbi:hypothetical protein BJ170DRAFT_455269 [Xylariales sp. AK1849]|nr:hypothetical protein BJ170DRAFT_455269 [Xylariales sp. AK1849]
MSSVWYSIQTKLLAIIILVLIALRNSSLLLNDCRLQRMCVNIDKLCKVQIFLSDLQDVRVFVYAKEDEGLRTELIALACSSI